MAERLRKAVAWCIDWANRSTPAAALGTTMMMVAFFLGTFLIPAVYLAAVLPFMMASGFLTGAVIGLAIEARLRPAREKRDAAHREDLAVRAKNHEHALRRADSDHQRVERLRDEQNEYELEEARSRARHRTELRGRYAVLEKERAGFHQTVLGMRLELRNVQHPTSVTPVPETGQAEAQLTALIQDHVDEIARLDSEMRAILAELEPPIAVGGKVRFAERAAEPEKLGEMETELEEDDAQQAARRKS